MPINLIYDATVIANARFNDSGRSGLCRVGDCILRVLLKHPEIKISLYCNPDRINDLRYVLQNNYKDMHNLTILNEVEETLLGKIQSSVLVRANNYRCKWLKRPLKWLALCLKILVTIKGNITKSSALVSTAKKSDGYLSPAYQIPPEIAVLPLKKYVILHDVIPLILPEYKLRPFSWFKKLLESINQYDCYFANSEYTKKDFLQYVPKLRNDQILVIPLAADDKFYQCKDENLIIWVKGKYGIPVNSRYIIAIGNIEPRKNLLFAIKNFINVIKRNDIADYYFLIGGAERCPIFKHIAEYIPEYSQFKQYIIQAGYIADEDLAPLYSGADFSVFISLYEGFGLPVLEAMQCGCPVITSKTSSLPEVAGDAASLVNPQSESEVSDAMIQLYKSSELRTDLRNRGLSRAKNYSWEVCGNIIAEKIIHDCINANNSL